jgi:hypothetical protein
MASSPWIASVGLDQFVDEGLGLQSIQQFHHSAGSRLREDNCLLLLQLMLVNDLDDQGALLFGALPLFLAALGGGRPRRLGHWSGGGLG